MSERAVEKKAAGRVRTQVDILRYMKTELGGEGPSYGT